MSRCCISTQSQPKPGCAKTSADTLEGTVSQPPSAASSRCQIAFSPFGLIGGDYNRGQLRNPEARIPRARLSGAETERGGGEHKRGAPQGSGGREHRRVRRLG